MRIILEGADGTGKTTLAKILADKYGLEIQHCTADDPKDFYFYKESLRKENIIWDRHTIGELIYPIVFDREAKITPYEAKAIIDIAKAEGVYIFVLTSSPESLKRRFENRSKEEHPKITKRITWINQAFVECAKWLKVPVIDTSKMTLNDIFALIEGKH